MNRRLIITADDYGMCQAVNRAIEECLDAGTVRATCAMMNMPYRDAVGSLRKKFPDSSLGVHWTLTQGRPVLKSSDMSTLVDKDGSFHSLGELRRRWLRRRIDPQQVKGELTAQFERFRTLAGQPDFWNTHQNVHVFPGLFSLFVGIGQKLNIPAMRSHRRITIPRKGGPVGHNISHPSYWLKGLIIARWSDRAESLGVQMPDGRLYTPGYNGKGTATMLATIHRVEWRQVKKAIEIVTHPATSVDKQLFGSITESRVVEYKTLTDPTLLKQLRQEAVDLVGFEALSCN
jgi:predicted glycoside hydrolase/deacetylase ChbG (UPF0249 family)